MLCKIDGCGRTAMYTEMGVCQKHYFRFRRNGVFETKDRNPKERYENGRGYFSVYEPSHPLSSKGGLLSEHRMIVYAKHGENLPDCELCGAPVKWATCHVDHKDENPGNNDPDNLRAVCRGCNTGRTPRSNVDRYEFAGLRLSLMQWERQPGVTGNRSVLKRRMAAGMTLEQALFARNQTHPKPAWEAA
jgi:5-methylcytosine-specific restriction endonuclease McrA